MKKFLLGLLPATLLMASCSNDDSHPSNGVELTAELPTVVIPTDQSRAAVFAGTPSYKLTQDFVSGQVKIAVNNFTAAGFPTLSFVSPEMAASGVQTKVQMGWYTQFPATSGQTLNYLSAVSTSSYYYYTGDDTTVTRPLGDLIYLSFQVDGQYTAKTFQSRCCFGGQTSTTYGDASFTTDKPVYMVDADIASGTATVTIFNAQFAEKMPVLSRMVISGLTLAPDRTSGYVIKGEKLTPAVGEGSSAVPYPQFAFDEFELRPVNPDLTSALITFKVAGQYTAKVTASYVK